MIIKRNPRSSTLTLTRCAVGLANDDDDHCKRPRPDPFASEMPRQDFTGGDVCSSAMMSSSSYCSDEVRSSADRRRTSRGRAQALPRRLADSVLIDSASKERPNSETLDPDFDGGGRNFAPSRPKRDESYLACRSKCFSTSQSMVTNEGNCNQCGNVVEQQWQNCNFEVEEEKEEFTAGDVVWAQLGKKNPAWPAIVVDSMHESEIDLCVPGAILVMFLGCFGTGNKRVK